MKAIVAFVLILLLVGCDLIFDEGMTFDEVSAPYLASRGTPEDIYTFSSGGYQSVEWWWWSQGFEVTFLDSPYDEEAGWVVDSTYSFEPF